MELDKGRIPLVIGVTGHRNPAADRIDAIERKVEEALQLLDALAPDTPFVLHTPLALGCDRIAARVAMRFKRARGSIRVIGVFPLAIDDYRSDFAADAADRAEFEGLLAKLDCWFELPRGEFAEVDAMGCVSKPEHRDLHYRRLGLFAALQSQVVIAMWDGVRNQKVGGTAEVVDFCLGRRPMGLEGGIPFRSRPMLLAPPDKTPVICIPTRREHSQAVGYEAEELAARGFDAQSQERLRELDLLNRRLAHAVPAFRPEMMEVDPPDRVAGPWSALGERLRRLDALAGTAKRSLVRSAWVVPSLAAVGVGAFEWFSSFSERRPELAWISLAIYFACSLVAVGTWWFLTKWRRTEWTFVHARALAEAMRIQYAWAGSGITEVATDLYFARRNAQVGFLRAQLRAAILDSLIVASRGGLAQGHEVGRKWIKEQVAYFDHDGTKMRERTRRVKWYTRLARFLRATVLLLSAGMLAIAVGEAVGSEGLVAEWANVGCFLIGLALACAVAFDYIRRLLLDDEDLDAAARMHAVFARAAEMLEHEPERAAEIMRALGREALDEQAEWFARHRDRLRLPEAG